MRRVGVALIAVVATLCLAACSAASRSSTPTHTRVISGPVAPCLASEPRIHAAFVGPDGLQVQVLGSGSRAVVVSEQSNEDLCAWKKVADSLVARGYEVVLYNFLGQEDKNAALLATWIRAHGANKVALLGGSEGAKASIVAAAALQDPPDALVALSPERYLNRDDVEPSAAKLRCPTLLLTADHDPYGSTDATMLFQSVAPQGVSTRVVVPGDDHGIELLDHADLNAQVMSFLDTHLGAG